MAMAHEFGSGGDPLMQPFMLKDLELKNRIMSTSHAAVLDEDELPKRRYQLYHETKAKGGLALTMFGGSANVAADSPSVFGQINVGSDRIIPYFEAFAERIHKHGAALMCQITHLGRRGRADTGNWLPTIGPSRVRETKYRSFPKQMDENDIARVVKAYGEAALESCHHIARQGGHSGQSP
jgi:2,4-dienoyl-CoA reductase-like NADH-dependent reductase (Old Yellow Enzyme family)